MKKVIFFVMFLVVISLVGALKDFDNDGMPDSWEKKYNLKYDVNDADEDPDNDGLTNLEEYNKGTNPLISNKKISVFTKIFGFLKANIIKIIFGIIALVILYFVIRIVNELVKIKKKEKNL